MLSFFNVKETKALATILAEKSYRYGNQLYSEGDAMSHYWAPIYPKEEVYVLEFNAGAMPMANFTRSRIM